MSCLCQANYRKASSRIKTGLNTCKTHFKGSVYLLTLTFSHSPDQSLRNNLSGLKRAMKRFYETTRVQAIFKELGVHHKIKGLEVTYGKMAGIPIIMFCFWRIITI